MEGDELRPHVPRPGQPEPSDGLVRQHGLRAADRHRRPQGGRQDRARPRDQERSRRVLLDRARLRRREPARDGARVRDDRERRQAGRRDTLRDSPRVVERVQRVRAGRQEENSPLPRQALDSESGSRAHGHPRGRRPRRARAGGRTSPERPSRARPEPPTTTPMRGSSAIRPSSSSPSGSDTRTELRPMLTEYGGEPVTGGTLPALIWKEFVERVDESDDDGSFEPAPVSRRRPDLGRQARRRVAARQRATAAARGCSSTSRARARRGPRTASRTRCRVPRVIGMTRGRWPSRCCAAQPLERGRRLHAGETRKPARGRGRPGSAHGRALGERRFSSSSPRRATGSFRTSWGRACGAASHEVRRLRLDPRAISAQGRAGIVIRQSLEAGVAAAPGLKIRLVVGDGSQKESS